MQVNGFEWKGKKLFVTGASGFKGAWACAAGIALGARVYATRRNHIHPRSAFELFDLKRQVTSVTVDISDHQALQDAINTHEPDVILHMAAKALVPVGLRDPRRALEVNIMGTANLIEACRLVHVCNRLLISVRRITSSAMSSRKSCRSVVLMRVPGLATGDLTIHRRRQWSSS
jgi:CDP-glucose 4,6-dehydratase